MWYLGGIASSCRANFKVRIKYHTFLKLLYDVWHESDDEDGEDNNIEKNNGNVLLETDTLQFLKIPYIEKSKIAKK